MAVSAPPADASALRPPPHLVDGYGRCVVQSERAPMTRASAEVCGHLYLLLKLSLLPDMDHARYTALPPEVRAQVSAAGYRALREWRRTKRRQEHESLRY
ncbi:MAG: hypothetical protein AAGG09_03270 [Pseudomonadota bacterium]